MLRPILKKVGILALFVSSPILPITAPPLAYADEMPYTPTIWDRHNYISPDRLSGADHIPKILTPSDIDAYTRAIKAMRDEKFKTGDAIAKTIKNPILMGYVRYEKYFSYRYRSSHRELGPWIKKYSDYPIALVAKSQKLYIRRKPKGAHTPRRTYTPVPQDMRFSNADRALRTKYVPPFNVREFPVARQARYDVVANRLSRALASADKVAKQKLPHAYLARWWGGIAAWMLKRYDKAASHFAFVANAERTPVSLRSAGAFWAARAYSNIGRPELVTQYLEIGTKDRYGFYGLLSNSALGTHPDFQWLMPALDKDGVDSLTSIKSVQRAIALVQIKEYGFADLELAGLIGRLNIHSTLDLMALSHTIGLPNTTYKVGRWFERYYSKEFASALYPIPPWTPKDGFNIDPALLYAISHKESLFKPHAKSKAGATGLMQLMPRTAEYIAKRKFRGEHKDTMKIPEYNLELGQKYVNHLFDQEYVGRNLMYGLVSYNAGPGNMLKWRKRQKSSRNDPLLYVETVPAQETRKYVEGIMARLWIYQYRLGKRPETLEDTVQNVWPKYNRQ